MESLCRPVRPWFARPLRLRVAFALLLAFLLLIPVLGSVDRHRLKDAVDHLVHRRFDAVAQREGGVFSPAALAFHAQRQTGGRVVQLELPLRYDRAVRMRVVMPYGETLIAFMDPYTADLRGTVRYAGLPAMLDKLLGAGYDVNAGVDAWAATKPGAVPPSVAEPGDSGSRSPEPRAGNHGASSPREAMPSSPEDLCSAESPDSPTPQRAMITLDDAIDRFERAGLVPPYTIVMPQGPGGFYRAWTYLNARHSTGVVDLDAYDGHRLDMAT
jgi:uncharacterized iron-regulated membrane protein